MTDTTPRGKHDRPPWCEPTIWEALIRHGQELEAEGGRPWPKGLGYLVGEADLKVGEYEEYGSAFFDVQPGNGTSYKIMATDLAYAQADYLVRRRLRVQGRDFPDSRDEYSAMLAAAGEEAAKRREGPAYSWGGDLLVAFPNMNGCVAYQLTNYVDPWFVTEHLGFRRPDAVPVAAFLSLFGAAVQNHREIRLAQAAAQVQPQTVAEPPHRPCGDVGKVAHPQHEWADHGERVRCPGVTPVVRPDDPSPHLAHLHIGGTS